VNIRENQAKINRKFCAFCAQISRRTNWASIDRDAPEGHRGRKNAERPFILAGNM
jgi:hypothetical protein